MSKILIVYHSKTGTTEEMAEHVKKGIENEGVKVTTKKVQKANIEDLKNFDGLILGSPTYYGTPAGEIEKFIDESIKYHGDLDGMVGGAFSSSANKGGGNETTIMSLLQNLLVHGMIIKGNSEGDHYGPVVVGDAEVEDLEQCKNYGKQIAKLLNKIN